MPLSSEKRQPRISTSDSGPLQVARAVASREMYVLNPFSPSPELARSARTSYSDFMVFRLDVADPQTGEETTWDVECDTVQEARIQAQAAGYLVGSVKPLNMTKEGSSNTPAPAAWLARSSTRPTKLGPRKISFGFALVALVFLAAVAAVVIIRWPPSGGGRNLENPMAAAPRAGSGAKSPPEVNAATPEAPRQPINPFPVPAAEKKPATEAEKRGDLFRNDPGESFKLFAAAVVEKLRTTPGPLGSTFATYSIDVKKTDSILTPYLGVLTVHSTGSQPGVTSDLIMTFAAQEGRWVVKSGKLIAKGPELNIEKDFPVEPSSELLNVPNP